MWSILESFLENEDEEEEDEEETARLNAQIARMAEAAFSDESLATSLADDARAMSNMSRLYARSLRVGFAGNAAKLSNETCTTPHTSKTF